jgi:hypothetical protein
VRRRRDSGAAASAAAASAPRRAHGGETLRVTTRLVLVRASHVRGARASRRRRVFTIWPCGFCERVLLLTRAPCILETAYSSSLASSFFLMLTICYDLRCALASASGLLVIVALLWTAPARAQEFQADPAWGGPKGERPLLGSKPGSTAGDPTTKGPDDGTTPPDPTRIPVDGGLALLALAGAGYAARKLRAAPASEEGEDAVR